MREVNASISITKVCGLFGKSRQAWYETRERMAIQTIEYSIVLKRVHEIREILPKLGSNKLFGMLNNEIKEQHIKLGRDSFYKMLKNNDLLIKPKRRYISTTNSRHRFKVWSNLVLDVVPTSPEQIWVSDITYIRIRDGFAFLNLITDAYSHKIMGFHLSRTLKAQGTIRALQMAIQNRQYDHPLIHHSDRGIQYCSFLYVKTLLNNQISISMTQDGNPYHNPIAERVNGILKSELGLSEVFDDYQMAIGPVIKGIHIYNSFRPHMSIDNFTPNQAHQMNGELKRLWKNNYQKKE